MQIMNFKIDRKLDLSVLSLRSFFYWKALCNPEKGLRIHSNQKQLLNQYPHRFTQFQSPDYCPSNKTQFKIRIESLPLQLEIPTTPE
jgi:hypothetical protein